MAFDLLQYILVFKSWFQRVFEDVQTSLLQDWRSACECIIHLRCGSGNTLSPGGSGRRLSTASRHVVATIRAHMQIS